jgi:hypothetical protein
MHMADERTRIKGRSARELRDCVEQGVYDQDLRGDGQESQLRAYKIGIAFEGDHTAMRRLCTLNLRRHCTVSLLEVQPEGQLIKLWELQDAVY